LNKLDSLGIVDSNHRYG